MTILNDALGLAQRGWRVLPCFGVKDGRCGCDKAHCPSPGKHPAFPEWTRRASCDPSVIRSWDWANRNLAVATGSESGLFVVDVDGNEGCASWTATTRQHQWQASTLSARTGSGGLHLYFRHPRNKTIRNRVRMAAGIDLRGDGGLIIAPPSAHIRGFYRWIDPEDSPATPPAWLLELIERPAKHPVGLAALDTIPKGQRNVTLFRAACSLRGRGTPPDEIRAEIIECNRRHCLPPLEAKEIGRLIESALRYAPGSDTRDAVTWFPTAPRTLLAAGHPWRAMNAEQRGWYWQLLLECWNNHGLLPNDTERLWRLAGASSLADFDAGCARLMEDFEPFELDGETFLVSRTLETACAEICPRFEQKRRNGLLGGRPKKAAQEFQRKDLPP